MKILRHPEGLTDQQFIEFFVHELALIKILGHIESFQMLGASIKRLGQLSQYEDMSRYDGRYVYVFSSTYLGQHVLHAQARL